MWYNRNKFLDIVVIVALYTNCVLFCFKILMKSCNLCSLIFNDMCIFYVFSIFVLYLNHGLCFVVHMSFLKFDMVLMWL